MYKTSKKFEQPTFIWDGYYNRCFYYDGIEINDNKIFYYGNLPYMYTYHSNDLSCDINSCKTGMNISSNQNQFKCRETRPTNYGITPSYPVDFSIIEGFFNAIGSIFNIPPRDNIHWAIFFPLMIILAPLSSFINIFLEPWINLINFIKLVKLFVDSKQ